MYQTASLSLLSRTDSSILLNALCMLVCCWILVSNMDLVWMLYPDMVCYVTYVDSFICKGNSGVHGKTISSSWPCVAMTEVNAVVLYVFMWITDCTI